jgi:hypothetical protein
MEEVPVCVFCGTPKGMGHTPDCFKVAGTSYAEASGTQQSEVPSEAPGSGEWVPVAERLPEEEGFYLVCHDSKKVFKCDCWDADKKQWMDLEMTKLVNQLGKPEDEKEEYEITHWMPLPEAPRR